MRSHSGRPIPSGKDIDRLYQPHLGVHPGGARDLILRMQDRIEELERKVPADFETLRGCVAAKSDLREALARAARAERGRVNAFAHIDRFEELLMRCRSMISDMPLGETHPWNAKRADLLLDLDAYADGMRALGADDE